MVPARRQHFWIVRFFYVIGSDYVDGVFPVFGGWDSPMSYPAHGITREA